MMTAHREAFNQTAAALEPLWRDARPTMETADDLTIGPVGILLGMNRPPAQPALKPNGPSPIGPDRGSLGRGLYTANS